MSDTFGVDTGAIREDARELQMAANSTIPWAGAIARTSSAAAGTPAAAAVAAFSAQVAAGVGRLADDETITANIMTTVAGLLEGAGTEATRLFTR